MDAAETHLRTLALHVIESIPAVAADARVTTEDTGDLVKCLDLIRGIVSRLERLKTMPYGLYLTTAWWKAISTQRKMHDRYFCQKCGAREAANEQFHAHHVTYIRRGCERLEDLVTLCPECHAATHSRVREPAASATA